VSETTTINVSLLKWPVGNHRGLQYSHFITFIYILISRCVQNYGNSIRNVDAMDIYDSDGSSANSRYATSTTSGSSSRSKSPDSAVSVMADFRL